MTSNQRKYSNRRKNFNSDIIEVKSKFYAEFRRFSISRQSCPKFDDFQTVLIKSFRLEDVPLTICYTDPIYGDLLPINNDENYAKAISVVQDQASLLRILLQRLEEDPGQITGYGTTTANQKRKNRLSQYLLNVPNYIISAGSGITSELLNHSPTALAAHNYLPYNQKSQKLLTNGSSVLGHEERLLTLHAKPNSLINTGNVRHSLPTPFISTGGTVVVDSQSPKNFNEMNNLSTLLKTTQRTSRKPIPLLPPILDEDLKSELTKELSFTHNTKEENSLSPNIYYHPKLLNQKSHRICSTGNGPTITKNAHHNRPLIGGPIDFRTVSSIIDVDVVPETQRRVRLVKPISKSGKNGIIDNRPLGFYIKEGFTVKITPKGLEKVTGIFISRMIAGGIAAGTGLLAVGDEILEVNGINVDDKTLDQVTDMMIANAHNLVITVKPVDQSNTLMKSRKPKDFSTMNNSTTLHNGNNSISLNMLSSKSYPTLPSNRDFDSHNGTGIKDNSECRRENNRHSTYLERNNENTSQRQSSFSNKLAADGNNVGETYFSRSNESTPVSEYSTPPPPPPRRRSLMKNNNNVISTAVDNKTAPPTNVNVHYSVPCKPFRVKTSHDFYKVDDRSMPNIAEKLQINNTTDYNLEKTPPPLTASNQRKISRTYYDDYVLFTKQDQLLNVDNDYQDESGEKNHLENTENDLSTYERLRHPPATSFVVGQTQSSLSSLSNHHNPLPTSSSNYFPPPVCELNEFLARVNIAAASSSTASKATRLERYLGFQLGPFRLISSRNFSPRGRRYHYDIKF